MDGLTCPPLDELRSLVRPAERRHHDLVKSPGGQRGEPVLSRLAGQRHRRENPSVVEEQSDLKTSGVKIKQEISTHSLLKYNVVIKFELGFLKDAINYFMTKMMKTIS